jgi:hypothetical protein
LENGFGFEYAKWRFNMNRCITRKQGVAGNALTEETVEGEVE